MSMVRTSQVPVRSARRRSADLRTGRLPASGDGTMSPSSPVSATPSVARSGANVIICKPADQKPRVGGPTRRPRGALRAGSQSLPPGTFAVHLSLDRSGTLVSLRGRHDIVVEIPYTSFNGVVRQFETGFANDLIRDLYNMCFTLFTDLERSYAFYLKEGIEYFDTAAGTQVNFGSRPRRFAGGPGLRPESYFTVCGDAGDHGTLRDELTAYYGAKSGATVMIYDPCVDSWISGPLQEMGITNLDIPLLYFVYQLEDSITSEDLAKIRKSNSSLEAGARLGVTYGVRQSELNLSRVIDLRNPDVQDWFVQTFVAVEVEEASHAEERGRTIHLSWRDPPSTFGELLPVITSLETGGGMVFSQAVGAWLRTHGADG